MTFYGKNKTLVANNQGFVFIDNEDKMGYKASVSFYV